MKTRIAPAGRTTSAPHLSHPAERCGSCGQPLGLWATDKLTGLLDRWGWDEEFPRVWTHVRRRQGIRSVAVPVRTAGSTTTTTITEITASIGIAAGHPGHDLELFDDLLLNADAALRDAKSCGRDQIRVGREPGSDT